MFSCTIPMRPFAKARPRGVLIRGKVRHLTSKDYRDQLKQFRQLLATKRPEPLTGELTLFADFYMTPKPGRPPDLDNLLGGLMDGCNGICYKDDSQIVTIGTTHRIKHPTRDEIRFKLVEVEDAN